jgi:hypothetical protein
MIPTRRDTLNFVDDMSLLLDHAEALQEGIVALAENTGAREAIITLAYMALDEIKMIQTELQCWYKDMTRELDNDAEAPPEDSRTKPWSHEPGYDPD